jgi:hypothetical protein
MSGGHFNYMQYYISEIYESINEQIKKNGKQKEKDELYYWDIENDNLNNYKYPDNVIKEFKKAVKILKQAEVYAQRIDWLLSGDDGDETFIKRLKEELNNLKK